jgi:hypothetical protein
MLVLSRTLNLEIVKAAGRQIEQEKAVDFASNPFQRAGKG